MTEQTKKDTNSKTKKKTESTDKSFKEEFLNPSEEQAYAQTFIEHGKNKEKSYYLSILSHGLIMLSVGLVVGLVLSLIFTFKWAFADSTSATNAEQVIIVQKENPKYR